jgi:hypothetical protein
VEVLEAVANGDTKDDNDKPLSPMRVDTARWILEHVIGKAPMSVDLSGSLQIEDIRVAVERVTALPAPTPSTPPADPAKSDLADQIIPADTI